MAGPASEGQGCRPAEEFSPSPLRAESGHDSVPRLAAGREAALAESCGSIRS